MTLELGSIVTMAMTMTTSANGLMGITLSTQHNCSWSLVNKTLEK